VKLGNALLKNFDVLEPSTGDQGLAPTRRSDRNPMGRGEFEGVVPTSQAAILLNRQPQTLRKWACLENGPIRPVRINGRLAWRVSDLKNLLLGGVV